MINFEFVGKELNEHDTVALEFALCDLLKIKQEDMVDPSELNQYTINVIKMEYRLDAHSFFVDLVMTDDSAIAEPRFISFSFFATDSDQGLVDNNPYVLLYVSLHDINYFNSSFLDFAKQQQML